MSSFPFENTPFIEDHKTGDIICKKCGRVLEERFVDQATEWRNFAQDDNGGDEQNRVGGALNPLYSDSSLGTQIGTYDFNGKLIRSKMMENAARIQSNNNYSALDRGIKAAVDSIDRIGDQLKLTKVVKDHCALVYKDVASKKQLRGHNVESVVVGCVYIACRQEGMSRSFAEIFQGVKSIGLNITKKSITKSVNFIKKVCGLRLDLISSQQYISRYCDLLQLDEKIKNASGLVAEEIVEKGLLSGRDPRTVSGITEQTIKLAYEHILPKQKTLIPKSFVPIEAPQSPN
ncbi:MAG: putative transcription initiation factor IIB [Streblomastix strix]|uniref:General transcription factor TFIIB n=1 Tax=Streblomastix strix TaxID=222440 RepID=A0A5J4WC33_9EUKA|nr:MAG: putative transcription initiation factor IIB [Streblomastix strix]